jgi:hypothetical protein
MAKIDIITLSGFTAGDGSVLASGATVKFSSEFQIGNTQIIIRPQAWRNRQLFEDGFDSVPTKELPNELILEIPEEEYYTLTPAALYEYVKDELNAELGDTLFEVVITP